MGPRSATAGDRGAMRPMMLVSTLPLAAWSVGRVFLPVQLASGAADAMGPAMAGDALSPARSASTRAG